MYCEFAPQPGYAGDPALPRRKRDVPSSFSAVQDLMPGKEGESEPERAPGWVAVDGVGNETLVPVLKDLLVDVDLATKRIVVRDVPGLTVPQD